MNLKAKLKKNQLTIGSWITLAHPAIAEIMAKAGFEWLAVDLEHSVITIREAEELIRIIELCGVTPLVRLSTNDPIQIKRVMDAGAHGVIVPMVNSVEDAQKAVDAVYYPPIGTRGVGLARAQTYGAGFEGYKAWLKGNAIVIVQIEHIKAVNNLEEILAVDGVDGFIVGPYDLSGSLNIPGEFDHPEMVKGLHKIKNISEKTDKPSGFHVIQPDIDMLMNKIHEGYLFIAFSLDILFLGRACRDSISKIKNDIVL